MGPSWFWPQAQPEIAALVQELGLAHFPQHSDGDVLFERMSGEAPFRSRASDQPSHSMRLAGGTGALISALVKGLPAERVLTGSRVTQMALGLAGVTLSTLRSDGSAGGLSADRVIAALPPRLLAGLTFSPAVAPDTIRRWQDTATWMAPHAKFFAIYDQPFWREAGFSGTAQSLIGPMSESHDATTASGKAALFGFLGIGADMRASLGEVAVTEACLAQFARLYGPDALRPRATLIKDWAADALTATAQDRATAGHPHLSAAPWVTGAWQDRLSLCASETSGTEAGLMAGAISAGHRAAAEAMRPLTGPAEPGDRYRR